MTKIMQLRDIKDTKLWNYLSSGFINSDFTLASGLAQNVAQICEELTQRIKGFYSLHPQFTLHDEMHFLRVTELMSLIIPEDTLQQLNPIEVALLIYVAFFHDQGMILTGKEIAGLEVSKDFQVFKENWFQNYPNYSEIIESSRTKTGLEYERCVQSMNELRTQMFTDYIRVTHGKRSADFVKSEYAVDKRLEACSVNLSDLIANICWSHVRPISDICQINGYYWDESFGSYTVNLQYIAVILRLADILDFDRDRTPESLYRTIHFSSDVSVKEWEKHRSVEGWIISKDLIRFTIKCEHPVYQKTAMQFMDWIDEELINAHNLVNRFPQVIADKYKLHLPIRVDRSRIEPKNNAYTYYDLEFSLSRDAVVKLLMTDRLYNSPSLCIRELLQNSLDALRHRKAIMKRDNGTQFIDGRIEIEHTVDEEGYEILRCTDNGVGMNEAIIQNFLTKAGNSYYRSSEFLQERNTFLKFNIDFDPCGQFGIGFMSCFMFGDRIKIYTRRDRGPNNGYEDPIIVEINGLGGIVVIKRGKSNQPVGTSVEIIGRKKPRFLDESEDILKLVDYVSTVCIGTEYPIIAQCSIPEIRSSVTVMPNSVEPLTYMELAGLRRIKTYYQSFTDVHPLLMGGIKISFLVDEKQQLTLENEEASWSTNYRDSYESIILVGAESGNKIGSIYNVSDGIALDGILVCGRPPYINIQLDDIGVEENIHTDFSDSYIVDVRGKIKPELTPARTLPTRTREDWDRIEMQIKLAHGRLWEQVLKTETDYEILWQLAQINNANFSWINSRSLWEFMHVPLIDESGNYEWITISKLKRIYLSSENDTFRIVTQDNKEVAAYEILRRWDSRRYGSPESVEKRIQKSLISMCTVCIENDQAFLEVREPSIQDKAPFEFMDSSYRQNFALPFSAMISHLFAVEMPIGAVNREHPLIKLAIREKYSLRQSDIEYFSEWATHILGRPEVVSIILSKSKKVKKDMRTLGRLSESLDWSLVLSEFQPPYLIWTQTEGIISVSIEMLKEWAHAEVI